MDDNDITRRNLLEALGAAGVAATGAAAGKYIAENEDGINQKGAEANYIGKNTDIEGISIRNIDVSFYPQQRSGGNEASGMERIGKVLRDVSAKLVQNGVLEHSLIFADVSPAPVDGGGQYQGNAASTGYTETAKDPVTGFGEPETVDTGDFGLPPVSLAGRTAIAGGDNMYWYDQNGNETSVEKGKASLPAFLNNGSEIVGADEDGLFKFNADTGALVAKDEETGSQGALKVSDGIIAVEADGNADFYSASDLSRISSVSNQGPSFRTLVFADKENVIYSDGESLESADPREGIKNWSVDSFGSRLASVGGATNGDEYAATTTDGRIIIFDKEDGERVATRNTGSKRSVSSPLYDEDSNLYTATERVTKFNDNYEEQWRTNLDDRANVTVGADNALIVSTTSSVQMLDKDSGDVLDRVLSNGNANLPGMPRNGKLPVVESTTGRYLEIPIERNEQDRNRPASAYLDSLNLQAPEDAVSVGETAQLTLNAAIEDDAPAPVRVTYELVVRHEGEQGILEDTTIGQPGGTATENYPVTTESSEQDAVTTNETAIDWDVKFEDDSTPGNETARANATTTNSTFSN